MTKEQRDEIISWLKDAHAMELSLVKNLEGKKKDADKAGNEEVRDRIDSHLEETKRHAVLVEGCIKRLGGDISSLKDMMGKTSGYMQGGMNSMYEDVMVKNALESYAAEHFEIAAYTSIMAAAEELGDMETVEICSEILEEEEDMADWLLEHIPSATREHLGEVSDDDPEDADDMI